MAKVTKVKVKMQPPKFIRVAAYTRVSESSDRLLNSLSNQVSYYSEYIQKHQGWEYAGVFTDEGITGTKTKRPGFQALMKACDEGKIDLIITKSISRFARNTVDTLEAIRHLKSLNVAVIFEKEGINSLSEDGELMISLLASFAQEESRSMSENIKWGHRRNFEKGIPSTFRIYGYRKVGSEMIIVPEEAEVIRRCFKNYLNGIGPEATATQLNAEKVSTYENSAWQGCTIRYILKNERYTGNQTLQKTYIEDYMTHKSVKNNGELPMYYVENCLPAIIDKETFEKVQSIMKEHQDRGIWSPGASCFTRKIVCASCGRTYYRGVDRRNGQTRFHYWSCSGKYYKLGCTNQRIREDVLIEVFNEEFQTDVFNPEQFLNEVDFIKVYSGNEIDIVYKDGRTIHKDWEVKKGWFRWTEEQRAALSEIRKQQWREKHAKQSNSN